MGDNVGDDDGTSRMPHISLPALPALPDLPCSALRYRVPRACFVCLLEFNVEEIMYKL